MSSSSGSKGEWESMKEILREKPFPVMENACPIQIEMNRFPVIDSPRRKAVRKKGGKIQTAEIILPDINSQETSAVTENYFNFDNIDNLEQFHATYGPFKVATGDDNEGLDVVGPSACQNEFELGPENAPEILIKTEEEKIEESHALKRWMFWMKDKHRVQNYLAKRLQRRTCRLLLQDSDKLRTGIEEKWLCQMTQIPEADKWRGHPFRWKAELRLPNRNIRWNAVQPESPPVYCAVKTELDKGVIPDIEFIGIPRTIQKEKGFVCQPNSVEGKFAYIKPDETGYLLRRRKKLKPHDINMDELEVIGRKIYQPRDDHEDTRMKNFPTIQVTEVDGTPQDDQVESIFCLMIGKEEIKYELKHSDYEVPDKGFDWQVNFAVNTIGALLEQTLRVENRGTVAVRYHWISEQRQQSFNLEKLQPRKFEPWFFFNKNSGFFLPGQVYHLKFYHHSQTPGIRKEVWRLQTEPPLSECAPCTVTLSAITTDDFTYKQPNILEEYLNNRVRESIIGCIMDIILRQTFQSYYKLKGIEYRSIFPDRVLFECHNPNHYYNSTIVNDLNLTFKKVTDGSEKEWDLSLNSFIKTITTHKSGKERADLLSEIAEKAKLLLRPNYLSVMENPRYRMTYAILCKMMNSMEEDYSSIKSMVSHRREIVSENFPYNPGSSDTSIISEYSPGELYGQYSNEIWLIKPINFLFFKTMVYIKVYYRVCTAIENIAGVLETRKLFEPWRKSNPKPEKPYRKVEEHPYISNAKRFRT